MVRTFFKVSLIYSGNPAPSQQGDAHAADQVQIKNVGWVEQIQNLHLENFTIHFEYISQTQLNLK
jgi:hypothetical protein